MCDESTTGRNAAEIFAPLQQFTAAGLNHGALDDSVIAHVGGSGNAME